jgi:hypothetical protein
MAQLGQKPVTDRSATGAGHLRVRMAAIASATSPAWGRGERRRGPFRQSARTCGPGSRLARRTKGGDNRAGVLGCEESVSALKIRSAPNCASRD